MVCVFQPPKQKISDEAELKHYRMRKRKVMLNAVFLFKVN